MRTSVSVILALFQECLDDGCTQSALKVHVASIVAHHAPTAACSIGKNYLIIRFPTDVEFISFVQGTGYNIWFSPPSREQQDINLLCLVQALHIYIERSSHFHNFVHSKITLFFSIFSPSLCCTSPNLNDGLFSVKHYMRFFCNALFLFALSHALQWMETIAFKLHK